jgi:hypothetical protein
MRKQKRVLQLEKSFGQLKKESFNFSLIKKYFNKKDNSGALQVLSDRTCSDLDFEELFMFLDRTTSKVGQQCLYNQLRVIPSDFNSLKAKEQLICELSENTSLRVNAQLLLQKLQKEDAYYIRSLFQDKHKEAPKWFFVIRLLSFTSILSLVLSFITPAMLFVFMGTFIVNIGFHYWNKRHLFEYLHSVPELLKLNGVAQKLIRFKELNAISPQVGNAVEIIKKIRNRMSLFRLEANMQNEVEVMFWGILELFKIAFLLEPLLLFNVLRRLNTKREAIEEVFHFVGEVDIAISTASLRSGLDQFCIPTIHNKEMNAQEVYHPLIVDCITNSIEVTDKSVLLTGSNMSGKTSFIRTIGINVITGLTLNTCFAQSMKIPHLRVFSAIRISDDLMNDRSYYFQEVLTIKEMITESKKDVANLFLLDEIFKGTNTVERIAAGKAVLSALTANNNKVFVSTHDIELTDMLADEYDLYHFSEMIKENNVDFDYKLKAGKLKNRNAIRILQINNYPEKLIDEAITISKELDVAANNK